MSYCLLTLLLCSGGRAIPNGRLERYFKRADIDDVQELVLRERRGEKAKQSKGHKNRQGFIQTILSASGVKLSRRRISLRRGTAGHHLWSRRRRFVFYRKRGYRRRAWGGDRLSGSPVFFLCGVRKKTAGSVQQTARRSPSPSWATACGPDSPSAGHGKHRP